MLYEVAIRDGAGIAIWMCGWYQGEEAWNNDAPAIEAPSPKEAAATAARHAVECKTLSIPIRGGGFRCQALVRTRDERGATSPQEEFTVTLRSIVSSVEAMS